MSFNIYEVCSRRLCNFCINITPLFMSILAYFCKAMHIRYKKNVPMFFKPSKWFCLLYTVVLFAQRLLFYFISGHKMLFLCFLFHRKRKMPLVQCVVNMEFIVYSFLWCNFMPKTLSTSNGMCDYNTTSVKCFFTNLAILYEYIHINNRI